MRMLEKAPYIRLVLDPLEMRVLSQKLREMVLQREERGCSACEVWIAVHQYPDPRIFEEQLVAFAGVLSASVADWQRGTGLDDWLIRVKI